MKKQETAANWVEIYEKWEDLPDDRLLIDPTNDGGENVWCKRLPDSTLGLNNQPLHPEYRWQDIVTDSRAPKVLHRRWNAQVWFKYPGVDDEAVDLPLRGVLASALAPVGHVSFWWVGSGYCLVEDADGAEERVTAALGDLGTVVAFDAE